ncbi:MAG: cytochrome c biogenesis protein CcsA [Pseudomonadota bacterium]
MILRFIILILLTSSAFAEENSFDFDKFAQIPILHEGRIKPIDSFARVMLKKIHGDIKTDNKSAIEWLVGVIFQPENAVQQNIFLIQDKRLISNLAITENEKKLYSFKEVADAFADHERLIKTLIVKDKKILSNTELDILALYEKVTIFAELIGSFSIFTPINDGATYFDMLKSRQKIESLLKETVKKKGDKIVEYNNEEQEAAQISYRMNLLENIDKNNNLLRIIPPNWEGTEEWLSLWAVIQKGAGSPLSTKLFAKWRELKTAYIDNNTVAWSKLTTEIGDISFERKDVRPFAIKIEVIYNKINPLNKSLILYAFAFFAALLAIVFSSQRFSMLAYAIMPMAILIHGSALLVRMIILMRPPVSTLYESMIFVAFVAAIFGIWLEYKKGGNENLLISALIAPLLISAANIFAADSDTLEVLVAVLNTNFWLGTHVVCITIGYASSLILGTMAHVYLIKAGIGKTSKENLAKLNKQLHSAALIALVFTAVGTMLGGIWADQSWGRFWGWDPKENGALWIVLWLVWLLHGRIAGQLREIGFASGLALINIVVALAWVGVNLLNVGLHSYGFTNIAANILIIFVLSEIVFVGFITILARKNQ